VSSQPTAALAERFTIPGTVQIVAGNGGLAKVVVATPEGNGEMYLHGAHVTSWIPRNQAEVLYLSPNSLFQDGRAIRGGVPICFPWFGDKTDDRNAPAHGFVRTKTWNLDAVEKSGQGIAVTMSTGSDDATRKSWPIEFRLACRVTFGRELKLELITTNTGSSPFRFEEALHAYFAVDDAESAFVRGLDTTHYLDKTDNRTEKTQTGDLHISAETDRVYLDTETALQLFDRAGSRRADIAKQNSRTTVVWNPWVQKSIELQDLGADQWRSFVCVETSNVAPLSLQVGPGASQTMTAVISAAPFQD
jgi:glucose-6-phosphate 1-epimerase